MINPYMYVYVKYTIMLHIIHINDISVKHSREKLQRTTDYKAPEMISSVFILHVYLSICLWAAGQIFDMREM